MNRTMNRLAGHCLFRAALLASLAATASPLLASDQWTAPTKEELSMTSQPEVPGAAAVYLDKVETTEDRFHMWSVYVRLKVLTEKGKDYANVELKYASAPERGGYTVSDVAGRTIHPDGTIIPFTGKPYEKLIEKTQDFKYMAKVFTLPDVEIGSILEYRYTLRWDDNMYMSPDWFIQSELFLRKGRYLWKPTSEQLLHRGSGGREQLTNTIGWFPVLPSGAEVKQTRLPSVGMQDGQLILELNVHDIPPAPKEEYMPPISAFTYRVLFYYSPYRSMDEFWKNEGKFWSKDTDKFIGPGSKVAAAVHELTSPSDTVDQKLRKLYAAVMKLENTDFTREHERAEDKAAGLREVHNTDDILERKRGSSDQLAELFIAMARAAGMKAYAFAVTNRSRSIFAKGYLSLSQLDDVIAVVEVDGKEKFFDPGSRYCPYGHLEWQHTFVGGLRQVEGGTAMAETSGEPYNASRIQRVANLNMDDHGEVTGTVQMTYMGAPALTWRHRSLSGDQASLERELRTSVEKLLPGGMEVKVSAIDKLESYEEPLSVTFNVKGPIGAPTGKRLLIPGDIFVSNEKASFPHEKRDIPVYFDYTHMVQDAVRVRLPASIKVESIPASEQQQLKKAALYNLTATSAPGSVTVRRNLSLAEFVFMPNDYAELRAFYNKMETKDQESVVLTASPAAATAKPAGSGN